MTTLAEIEVGCGRTTGHGESCATNHLCDSCDQRRSTYMLHSNLQVVCKTIRKHPYIWRRISSKRGKMLQKELDGLLTFIEDEMDV